MVKHNKNFCHLFVIDQNKGQDFVSCFYDEDFLLTMEKFVVVVFVLVFTNILNKGERWKQKKKSFLSPSTLIASPYWQQCRADLCKIFMYQLYFQRTYIILLNTDTDCLVRMISLSRLHLEIFL